MSNQDFISLHSLGRIPTHYTTAWKLVNSWDPVGCGSRTKSVIPEHTLGIKFIGTWNWSGKCHRITFTRSQQAINWTNVDHDLPHVIWFKLFCKCRKIRQALLKNVSRKWIWPDSTIYQLRWHSCYNSKSSKSIYCRPTQLKYVVNFCFCRTTKDPVSWGA